MNRIGGRAVGGLLLASCLLAAAGLTDTASASASTNRGITAAAAGTAGPCPTTTDGVTVVVDFQGEGGHGTTVRCAPGSPDTGIVALREAGFRIEGLSNGAPFVCRIEGQPTADSGEDCVGTPPSAAYWAYYYAPRGGSWTYSGEGGGGRKPPVGSVDGWSFTRGGSESTRLLPRVAPPATPTTTTQKPTTTTRPPGTTTPPAPATTTTRPPSSGTTPTTPGPGTTPTTTRVDPAGPGATPPGGPPGTSPGDPGSTTSSSSTTVGTGAVAPQGSGAAGADDGADAADELAGGTVELRDDPDTGSPVALALGGTGVAILGAAAVLSTRQRRRAAAATIAFDQPPPPPDAGTG